MQQVTAWLILSGMVSGLWAHGDEVHRSDEKQSSKTEMETTLSDDLQKRYKIINSAYLAKIKPVFQKKCFDCHSDSTKYPWYHKVPGVKQMIDKDIKEGRSHIDFTEDFPFISHETPMSDLKSLREIGLEGGMPPIGYILGHWESRLSDEEKKALVNWAERSMNLLEGETHE
jgi:cytochrome c5